MSAESSVSGHSRDLLVSRIEHLTCPRFYIPDFTKRMEAETFETFGRGGVSL
jgi:hypothetical protein